MSSNLPLTLSTCTFTYIDCDGNLATATVADGQGIYICTKSIPVGNGCTINYFDLGLCIDGVCPQFVTTTTTGCGCWEVQVDDSTPTPTPTQGLTPTPTSTPSPTSTPTPTASTGGGGTLAVSCQGPTCDNAANGSINVIPTSSNSPYIYQFNKGGVTYSFNSSSNNFTYGGFSSGTWNIVVTDSLSNTETGSCTLSETFTHSFTANGSNITFNFTGGFGSPNNTNYYIASASSNGNQDGRVFVSNIGTDGDYTITSLASGSYVFIVGDTYGCVYQFASVTLPAASPIIRTISPLTLGYNDTLTLVNPNQMPRYDHVFIMWMENKSYSNVVGNQNAPFINNTLIGNGTLFTNFYAYGQPSQPNYICAFAGHDLGCTSNIQNQFTDGQSDGQHSQLNLYTQLLSVGVTFESYCQSLPQAGSMTWKSGNYTGIHDPARNFNNVPQSTVRKPFTQIPTNLSWAANVVYLIPDNAHNMHDNSISDADNWMATDPQIQSVIEYCANPANNSLFVLYWDESVGENNKLAVTFYGNRVKQGHQVDTVYGTDGVINNGHYYFTRTILTMFGAPYMGRTGTVTDMTGWWI